MSLALGLMICPDPDLSLLVEVSIPSALSGFGVWDSAFWDFADWGPDDVWEDVSDYVRSVRLERRFADDWRTWRAAVVNIVLNNMDGRFSPENLTGPYAAAGVSRILSGRRLRISLIHRGNTYRIFSGKTNTWEEVFQLTGPRSGDAAVHISASDAWQNLSTIKGKEGLSDVGDGETFGPRIVRILTTAGFDDSISVDTGTVQLQPTDLSSDPVDELIDTAASEGGIVYVETDGSIVGLDRSALLERPRSITPQIEWGDGVGEIPWIENNFSPLSMNNVVNSASYTAIGGVQQTFRDEESIALYGELADQSPWVDRLLCKNDTDVLSLAVWATLRTIPRASFTSIKVSPFCMADPTMLLDIRMWDLHTITMRPPSATGHIISRPCFVVGVDWEIENGDINVRITYAPAGAYVVYATSRWDSALWGSSPDDPLGARFYV